METLKGLLALEEFDTAGFGAVLCTLQTLFSTYPNQDKRDKQAERPVRPSMSNCEIESTIGICVVRCVQTGKDKIPGGSEA